MLLTDDSLVDPRASAPSGTGPFSPEDFATLQKVLGTYLVPGVTAWSVLFGRAVELGEPRISLVSQASLTEMDAAVVGAVDFLSGVKGHAKFVLPLTGARVLVGLALGSPEPAQEFDAIHRSSFASVLKYLLAEMRSLIARGTGRRVGTGEPAIKLWPDEVLPESGHLVQAAIPWSVEGVQHPPLLFWADMQLTRDLLALNAPKPKSSMSPGESAWSGAAMRAKPAAPALKPNNRLTGGRGASGIEIDPRAQRDPLNASSPVAPQPQARPASPRLSTNPARQTKPGEELSIWSLGRASSQNPPDRSSTNEPEPFVDAAPAPRPPAPAPAPAPPVATAPAPPPVPEEQEMIVELGRAALREPLTLGQVVPLDRLAGESVDIFVDGHLVARGEVTVDGEVLAVRVTQTVPTRRK